MPQAAASTQKPDPIRGPRASGVDSEELRKAILAKLIYNVGKDLKTASPRDWFVALALAVRDRIVDRWMSATRRSHQAHTKQVYYLSVEFLIGRLLMDGLTNLGLTEPARDALAALGVDLAEVRAQEPDAALGNGGLGRLAACFMESMASIGLPAYGYGIRYEHGLFRQMISDGWQHEAPEDWLAYGNPWEFERPEVVYPIGFGGFVEQVGGESEAMPLKNVWHPMETVNAVAYDTPIVGWQGKHANTLRLWSARAVDQIDLTGFNRGDHVGSFAARAHAESISRVLYPSDETSAGQSLRLRQEYFFTSASLQDLIRRHLQQNKSIKNLADCAAIHMNDTHPAIAVAELMRLLVDEHGLPWNEAWTITQGTLNYTNHTLLPEALEAWPLQPHERPSAAAHADHLPHQPQAPEAGAGRDEERRRQARRRVADRGRRPEARPHGPSRLHRLGSYQRRFGAAHRPDEADDLRRSRRDLPWAHRQQDQRHHLSALADGGQSRPDVAAGRHARAEGAR